MGWFIGNHKARIQRNPSVEWRLIEEKAVLVNLEEGVLLKLDEVGTAVWLALDGTKKAADLVQHICGRYDVAENTAKKDIFRLLRHLKSNDAIEYEGGINNGIS